MGWFCKVVQGRQAHLEKGWDKGSECVRLTWCHFLGQAGVWVAPASLPWLRCFLSPDTESILVSGGGAASVPVVPASFLQGGFSLMNIPGMHALTTTPGLETA